jgi:long-chain acyl-CoA synthetase
LVALVVPNFEVVCHAVGSHKSPHDLVKNPQVKQLILNDLRRLSGRLAPFETIKKVGLIANEWSIEGTELTPTLKLRRQQINKKYHHLIESLYDT